MKKRFFLTVELLLLSTVAIYGQSPTRLWFDRPAQDFEQALVLGNGRMGATLYGGVQCEQIHLNDITLWSGEPVNPYMRPDAHHYIPKIRELLLKEDYKGADALNRSAIQGRFSEAYMPLGNMYIKTPHTYEQTEEYSRELDLTKAEATTSYLINGVKYTRTYFTSYPDSIMVIKLACDRKGELDFDLSFSSQLKYSLTTQHRSILINGQAAAYARPSYLGDDPNAVFFDSQRGTKFSTLIDVASIDGKIVTSDSTIEIRNATVAIIKVSIATSFNGFDKSPTREGKNNLQISKQQMVNAAAKSYETLQKNHLEDYQKYFSRVSLEFGKTNAPDIPTDERLRRYATGAEDKNLEILYFQYGRYLLISSSRTMGVPANLQGLWSNQLRAPWSGNYTININTQENYWLAESTNLSEMHQPMLTFIGNIANSGAITAKTFLGIDRGWTACHNSDIWAMSNPVGDFGNGNPKWANWYMGGPWLSTHLWEHYQYTKDINWLDKQAYTLMKGSAEFCLNWLIEDKNGNLVTSPSTSPENNYLTPDGYQGATLYGATSDIAIAREIMRQTLSAAKLLNVDLALQRELQSALDKLLPYKVGSDGSLQEWYHDWKDAEPQHRHQTHLFGLYPGHQISPVKTPELAEACKMVLDIKGNESTGWSKGWRINLWARLLDGERAHKVIRDLMRYVDPERIRKDGSGGSGTYPNLLNAGPPFQIDGNFAGAAAFAEMLIQSDESGNIHILPAIPKVWDNGSVKGICARGGFVADIAWKHGKATLLTILSRSDNSCTIHVNGKKIKLEMKKGERKNVNI